MSKNKGHFIVFQHVYQPAPGANTSMKNFGTEGQWRVQEMVYFVDRLRPRHWDSSTVIIDYDNWKVLKASTGGDEVTVQGMLDHVNKHYPQQYQQFMEVVKDVKPNKSS